jgi:choice-of-anchor C domain-containing protein
VDLNGNGPGAIGQTFVTTPGATYRVTFCLAGNPQGLVAVKTLDVSATGGPTASYQFDTTGRTLTDMGWTQRTYDFVATGASTTVTFTSTTSTAFGPAVDNVTLAQIQPIPAQTQAIPTVSEWGMAMLIGLIAMASIYSLRRRRST